MHPEGVFIMRFLPHPTDPERFFYDNMTLFRYVDDPGYTVPGWMGLPDGMDDGRHPSGHRTHPRGRAPELGRSARPRRGVGRVVQRGSKSRGFRGPLWSDQSSACVTSIANSTAISTAK